VAHITLIVCVLWCRTEVV